MLPDHVDNTPPTPELRDELAARRLGYKSVDAFLSFAKERVGSSPVADRWLHDDYQSIFNAHPDIDAAYQMLRQLVARHHLIEGRFERLAAAVQALGAAERRQIFENYPRLMDNLLDIEHAYRGDA